MYRNEFLCGSSFSALFEAVTPTPGLYTPLPIDTHLYFYHHPTAPTVGIVYDTIRLIISCLYTSIDRTANCTRHSDSKTVPPRALYCNPSAPKPGLLSSFFFFSLLFFSVFPPFKRAYERRNRYNWFRSLLLAILVPHGRLLGRHPKSDPWIITSSSTAAINCQCVTRRGDEKITGIVPIPRQCSRVANVHRGTKNGKARNATRRNAELAHRRSTLCLDRCTRSYNADPAA